MSLLDNVITAIFNPPRSIGSVAIQCTVEENHYDDLTVSDHPVEQGAMISDHAFKRPEEVIIRAGWSNSGIASVISDVTQVFSLLASGSLDFSDTTSPFNYAEQVYNQLLALQAMRQPLQIVTGKRVYESMLIKSLFVTTDEKTEHALFCTAICRQVILVQTQAVSFTPLDQQANPEDTAQTQNAGVQTLVPATTFNPAAAPAGTL